MNYECVSAASNPSTSAVGRVQAAGKFLAANGRKHWVRGVTYGTFAAKDNGSQYHDEATAERDFAQIAANGFNTIRTYTVPPRWFLDIAQNHGLRVMVGLAWSQHITFLDDRKQARSIEEDIRAAVRSCVAHPAILCYALGNEIPASIVRWYRPHRIESWLERLFQVAREEDPEGLFTYVNYPSTEYLELPFADLISFNVYLESKERLATYVARLQNIAGNRPLLLAEVGLDSLRNGSERQANVLDWQIRTAFESGCAGAFVFAWTDEWHRGGYEVQDWDFGLTNRRREPKPALAAVRQALQEIPFHPAVEWPRISVVVCTYNGSRTIRECCEGILKLEYPNFEVIVVDDGSTDRTAEIVKEYPFRLIRTKNCGLSSARNTGMRAATGEIVAYIDDDAYPDPDWLKYLANTLVSTDHAGVGGPNIPPDDDLIAQCVAHSPGGPIHVLLSDQVAEHIPGCNMAFWKNRLEAIDGFDVRYRSAGDDVDLCWRLQQKGWTLGFNAAAMVWHRRRNSVRGYWKQQKGYGRAEALLEEKWPQKYNRQGHLTWAGRIYTTGLQYAHPRRRIFHGVWGSALFQSVYEPAAGLIESLPLMPEWYLIIACLVALSALGVLWSPLWTAAILAVFAIAASVRCAWKIAGKVRISDRYPTRADRFRFRCLTAVLCTIQPLARLVGRLRSGLTPWRRHAIAPFRLPLRSRAWIWSQRWRSITEWLKSLESSLQSSGAIVLRGSEFDHWDLEVRGGTFGAVRVRTTIEEHGAGRQMVRFQLFPRGSTFALSFSLIFWALAFATAIDGIIIDSVILSIPALWLLFRTIFDCGVATSLVHDRIFAAKAAEREQRTSYVGAATGPEYQQSSVAAGSRRSHQQGY